MCLPLNSSFVLERGYAVSYTHLDVYKRQLSQFEIVMICAAESYESLRKFLLGTIDSNKDSCVGCLMSPSDISGIARHFQRAQEYICLRLPLGYGHLFTDCLLYTSRCV